MNADQIKKFMRPRTGFFLAGSILLCAGGIICLFTGKVLVGLLLLAFSCFLFYSMVFYEWKVFRENFQRYERENMLDQLAAEFQEAEAFQDGKKVRLGQEHLFIRSTSRVIRYQEIHALEKRYNKKAREKSLFISSGDQAVLLGYAPLSWRWREDGLECLAEALIQRNPEIRVIQRNV